MQGLLRPRRTPFERRARARVFVAVFTAVVFGGLAALGLLVAHLADESVEAAGVQGSEASAAAVVRVTLKPGDVRGGHLRSTRAPSSTVTSRPRRLTSARLLAERANRRSRPLVRSLRQAMRRGELALHYQPKLSLSSGTVEGVEALLRWHHPRYGDVSPMRYLPSAEAIQGFHVSRPLPGDQVETWLREHADRRSRRSSRRFARTRTSVRSGERA